MRPLLVLLALLVVAPAARAGTYVVRSCDSGSISGWSTAPYRPTANSCHAGGGALEARVVGYPGEATIWRFDAPPGTDISGFSIARSDWLNAGVAFGSPVYALQTFGRGARYSRVRANLAPVAVDEPFGVETASGLTGQTAIEFSVNCGGGGGCLSPAATARLYAANITLRDPSDPRIESVSGSLLDSGGVSGVRSLAFTATDEGGGVQRAELLVDGTVAATQAVSCDPRLVTPCKPRASGSLALDTRRLAEGRHAIALRVYDATGTNHDAWTGTLLVDNVPPPANRTRPEITAAPAARPSPAGAPSPAGRLAAASAEPLVPHVGATLVASPGAWTGAGLSFAYRWQRYDASWEEVAGATGSAYLPRAGDAGHRLRVRVTATNAEGSGVAYSEPTEPVAAPAPPTPPTPPAAASAPSAGSSPPAGPARVRAWIVRGRRHARSATVRWRAPVTIAGVIAGRAAGGDTVELLARVGAGRERVAAIARTAPGGRFTVHLGAGPSRRLVARAAGARSVALALRVRAALTLHAARNHRWIALAGRLRGGHIPRRGVLVSIQALRAHRWVTLTATRATQAGRYRARIPAAEAGRSKLRARVARQPGYPFAAGASSSA